MSDERAMPERESVLSQPEEVSDPKTGLFLSEDGLRSGWRLAIYLLIVAVVGMVVNLAIRWIAGAHTGAPGVWTLLMEEVVAFALVLGAARIMALIEGRRVGEYGLPGSELFGKKFWLGFVFGLVEIAALIGLISAFGGYSFGTLALQGGTIWKWGAFHLLLFTFVGFFEEFLFRGYVQYTLGAGVGFWPAAIVLSVLFGAVHLGNPGEGLVGAVGVVVVGLLFCFTLKRSGNLWYAVGMHASFDWGETYLFSVPNSGMFMQGHLSNSLLHGPAWLTGGSVGPEGSVFCFLTMGLQFLVVMWLFPAKKEEPSAAMA